MINQTNILWKQDSKRENSWKLVVKLTTTTTAATIISIIVIKMKFSEKI